MNLMIDNYNINYKITGNGENALVILQGWGTDLSIYDSVAECINDKYKVIQLDFPGFGSSDEPNEAWSVDDYADFFVKFMEVIIEKIEIKKFSLLGHSYGGRVIIKLATREALPFTIDKIVLLDSAGILPKKTARQIRKIKIYKLLKKIIETGIPEKICPELIEDWKSRQGSADYRGASPIMRKALVKAVNEDLTDLLPHIKEETLLIWGELDDATPLSDGKLMEDLIPNAGLAVIKGAGHYCFLEEPHIFKKIMEAFFYNDK